MHIFALRNRFQVTLLGTMYVKFLFCSVYFDFHVSCDKTLLIALTREDPARHAPDCPHPVHFIKEFFQIPTKNIDSPYD